MIKRSARLRGGFKGGKRLQGGWIAAALGLVGSIFGAKKAKKQAKQDKEMMERQIAAMDPYGPYRAAAAERLNSLTEDNVTQTQQFKTRQDAVARQMAAQGFTGSGNALIAASQAGGESYQQEFDNLARMAGIDKQPGAGYDAQTSAASGQAYLNQTSSAFNGVTYAAGKLWDAWSNRNSGG